MAKAKKKAFSETLFPTEYRLIPQGVRQALDKAGDSAHRINTAIVVATFTAVLVAGIIKGLRSDVEYH